MRIVTILTTGPLGESSEDFVHGDATYTFDRLQINSPPKLLEGPVWIFVDWLLAELSGLEMCRRLRTDQRTSNAHITILLEQDILEDRRKALRAGADDYFVGQPDRNEILDRVLASTAQVTRYRSQHIEMGDLTIDLVGLRAKWKGKSISLGPTEFRLLRYFFENPNQLLSREDIIAGIGKNDAVDQDRTVDVWVARIRRAFKAASAELPLVTIRGQGYVFDA